MPKLTVNGTEVEVEQGASVLQACEAAGAEIPRFCYHERLSIAGNCRMCLVEMEKAPKPVASCAMPAADGMVIKTNTESVEKARKGVMEFLLINHPLDCPICDQGGECDLQDQAMSFGADTSRYAENKRAVKDKELGPLVKTVMTRCIHCTRCVRFSAEVAGVEDLGATYRGEAMEIGTYVEKALQTELSGNLVDLCPVGALTSKPYAFTARPWELTKTETIDVMDAVGSNIRVDSRGDEVLRVLPRLNEEINEEWISDKTRYACDGLKRQRLDRPYLRKDGKLQPVSWQEALALVAEKLSKTAPEKIAAFAGNAADAESMFALKQLMSSLSVTQLESRLNNEAFSADEPASYLFNSSIAGIEEADAILLVGVNPRKEAPLVNARIRKRYLEGKFRVGVIGEQHDLTYPVDYIGAGTASLKELAAGKHEFAAILKNAEKPLIIVGQDVVSRQDGAAILNLLAKFSAEYGVETADWHGFNYLHRHAARVAALMMGFVQQDKNANLNSLLAKAKSGEIEVAYLLDADDFDVSALNDSFVIYQGHHGDAGANKADVILPGAAYTEKDGLYANLEGRVQLAQRAVFAPGEAKEDWTILRALSQMIGKTLPFDSLDQLRQALVQAHPAFAAIDQLPETEWQIFGREGAIEETAFTSSMTHFYQTDAISRASETMAKCSAIYETTDEQVTGTNG